MTPSGLRRRRRHDSHCDQHQLGLACDARLGEDVVEMGPHGCVRDAELGRDLRKPLSREKACQHALLGRGRPICRGDRPPSVSRSLFG